MFSRSSLLTAGLALTLAFGGLSNGAIAQIIRPELRSGSTGTAVRELQATLKLLNYYTGEVTGTYDEATVIAVYRFQKAAQLPETGVMDRLTWATLFPTEPPAAPITTTTTETTPTATEEPTETAETPDTTTAVAPSQRTAETLPLLREGMDGEAVTFLQQRLKAKGFFPGTIDGIFGPQTLQAVIAAQTALNLDGDGIVGRQTWTQLLK
ncbi:peptidoglycan-binding domain-containing protein [[Limnothrix rosea] IAM M-220]|uniref:peptidoglycan-binding domain-containing protein n=1 Tax=[Limnothrix rosea] IAM M-220 TaxID=454133 RepID=UPI00095F3A53|nr:peptidoglycan-binding protein [[Limnothrix rosea] IAM M-220]OKH19597.1 peptidoglycan-binding protein [[Limnothrix rosea] IAM M-220]